MFVQAKCCVVVVIALCAAGCGGSLQLRARVETPPELPLRVFPEVAVVHGTAPEDYEVAEALARHLASSEGGGLNWTTISVAEAMLTEAPILNPSRTSTLTVTPGWKFVPKMVTVAVPSRYALESGLIESICGFAPVQQNG